MKNFWKTLKATAIILTIFKDIEKTQDFIKEYQEETGNELTIEEIMDKSSKELDENPRTKLFIDWAVKKILAQL